MMETNATAERLGGAQRGEGRVSIRPTVLIGLGGTGKEVLRRLRRMFYEKYRMVGLPVMGTPSVWYRHPKYYLLRWNRTSDRRIDFLPGEKIMAAYASRTGRIRNNKGMYPLSGPVPEVSCTPSSTQSRRARGRFEPFVVLAFFSSL